VTVDLPDPQAALDELFALRERPLEDVGRWLLEREGGRALLVPVAEEAERRRRAEEREPTRELGVDVDPHDLRQARWGVVTAPGRFEQVKAWLEPLLDLRREQMGETAPIEPLLVQRHESAAAFLWRHGETVGVIDPSRVPYYLLIVGGPDEISWDFQYLLSVDRAVGRVAFDEPSGYGRYARAVVSAEREGSPLARRATLVSVENEGDPLAPVLANHLAAPLHRGLSGYVPGWEVDLRRRRRATRQALGRMLEDAAERPGLLLVGSHGMPVDFRRYGDEKQRLYQGALMCQHHDDDPRRGFAASDVPSGADLRGQIAFLFACYGAGTPVLDNFPDLDRPGTAFRDQPRQIAPRPFVARLPQALLGHGTLGVVGHVDRGWTYSFVWSVGGRDLTAVGSLEDSVKRLLLGDRLGHALRPLQRRGAALSSRLALTLDRVRLGVPVDPAHLADLWVNHNDARNFVVLGDPAVYLLGRRSGGEQVRLPEPLARRLRRHAALLGVGVDDVVHDAVESWLRGPGGDRGG
jgi:hypothetical protein